MHVYKCSSAFINKLQQVGGLTPPTPWIPWGPPLPQACPCALTRPINDAGIGDLSIFATTPARSSWSMCIWEMGGV